MTLATQTTIAERMTRTAGANTITNTSDVTKQYINEGVREFAKRVHGIAMETFISLNPLFEFDTKAAVKVTWKCGVSNFGSTDVPIASSALSEATPTTAGAHFASNLNATFATTSFSCGWSASTWTFVLSGPGSATSVAVGSPTDIRYWDGAAGLFGGAITKSGATITGGFPQNCTLESSLPSGFLEIDYVKWRTWELTPAPFDIFTNPQANGTPSYYAVKNKKIRLYPVPTYQDRLEVYYTGMPTDLGVDGSSDSTSCPLPEEMHMAPIHWAAAKLFEEANEYDKSIYHQRVFNDSVNGYIIREANNNPVMRPEPARIVPPLVVQ